MRRFAGKVLLVLGAVACFAAGGLADHLLRGQADAAEPTDRDDASDRATPSRVAGARSLADFGAPRSPGDGVGGEPEAEEDFPGPRPGETAAQLFDRAVAAATPDERRQLLYQVGPLLDPATAREALGWVDRLPSSSDRQLFTEDVIRRIGERDPEAALAQATELLRGQRRSDIVAQVVQDWSTREPERSLAWALAQPAGSDRDRALLTLMGTVAEESPERALEIASTLQQGAASDAMFDVFSAWSRTDPAAAAAHLADIPNAAARRNVTYDVASTWAEQAPEAALEWARALPGARDRASAVEGVIRATMRRDPAAGFELALRSEDISDQAIRDFAFSAASEDSASILPLVTAMPEGPRRDIALSSIVSIVAETEPERAARLAAGLTSDDERSLAYSDVARTLAQEDPAAAASWAAGLDDGDSATRALDTVVSTWSRNDPRAAAGFVQSLPRGELRDAAELSLVEDWADTDPQRAARWALTHGGDQRQLLDRLLERWVYDDEEQAAEWAEALPQGATRDGALVALGSAVAIHGDPAAAWAYIEGIGDEELREEQRRSLYDQWNAGEPEAAQAFLEQADLPDDVRSELLVPEPAGGCVCPGAEDEITDEVVDGEAGGELEAPEEA